MKKATLKLTSWLLVILILFTTTATTSCVNSKGTETENHNGAVESSPIVSSNDNSIPPESIPSANAPTDSDKDGDQSTQVTPDNESSFPTSGNDVSLAAAQGLRSAVSIFANFTTNSYWGTSTGTAAGSGVIYSLDKDTGSAFIITNYHVVYNGSSNTANHISDDIYVFLFGLELNEYAIPATYIGGSANYDIAVLRVDNSEILKKAAQNGSARAVSIANSDTLAAGQTAIAIGNPESDGISVTTGIVSVDSEYITMTSSDGRGIIELRVVRIDTAVNSGNSGGGLFNAHGELIGIVNAKMNSSDVENIGYAIPSNVARAIADNIIYYCNDQECESVMRGILGITVTVSAVSTHYDEELGKIVRTEDIRVYEVNRGGLAENILKADDIIRSITINGKTVNVTRQHHLIDTMLDVRVGDTVSLKVTRNGEDITVSTVISEDCLTAY